MQTNKMKKLLKSLKKTGKRFPDASYQWAQITKKEIENAQALEQLGLIEIDLKEMSTRVIDEE